MKAVWFMASMSVKSFYLPLHLALLSNLVLQYKSVCVSFPFGVKMSPYLMVE